MPADRPPVPGPTRLVAGLAVAILVAACTSSAASSPPAASSPSAAAPASGGSGTPVSASLSEFKIELGSTSIPAGPVTFAVKNAGTTVHEFVVFRTDLAADKLPMDSDEPEVNEDAEGIEAIDEVEDLEPGTSHDLAVTLTAGHYVAICNVVGHYQSGMRTEFTVGG